MSFAAVPNKRDCVNDPVTANAQGTHVPEADDRRTEVPHTPPASPDCGTSNLQGSDKEDTNHQCEDMASLVADKVASDTSTPPEAPLAIPGDLFAPSAGTVGVRSGNALGAEPNGLDLERRRRAFEEVCAPIRDALIGLCLKEKIPEEDASDVVQKVFEKVWKKWVDPQCDIKSLGAYLKQATKRACIDYWRGRNRSRLVPAEGPEKDKDSAVPSPWEQLHKKDIDDRLNLALTKLRKEEKPVYALMIRQRYYQKWPIIKIAKHHKMSPDKVKRYLREACRILRIYMGVWRADGL